MRGHCAQTLWRRGGEGRRKWRKQRRTLILTSARLSPLPAQWRHEFTTRTCKSWGELQGVRRIYGHTGGSIQQGHCEHAEEVGRGGGSGLVGVSWDKSQWSDYLFADRYAWESGLWEPAKTEMHCPLTSCLTSLRFVTFNVAQYFVEVCNALILTRFVPVNSSEA